MSLNFLSGPYIIHRLTQETKNGNAQDEQEIMRLRRQHLGSEADASVVLIHNSDPEGTDPGDVPGVHLHILTAKDVRQLEASHTTSSPHPGAAGLPETSSEPKPVTLADLRGHRKQDDGMQR